MSYFVFDISDNDRNYVPTLLRTINNTFRDLDVNFRLSDPCYLLKLYQKFTRTPFLLNTEYDVNKLENKYLVKFTSEINVKVIVINKYRCPGPVVEIMASLQGLSMGSKLDVVIFDNKIDKASLVRNLISRKYAISEEVDIGNSFYKLTIERNFNL